MKNIEISIKAYGCIGDDYEGKETVQTKQLLRDRNDCPLTEGELQAVLEILIDSVTEMKSLYPDEQTDVCVHNDNRLESLTFTISYNENENSTITLNEKSFFQQVAKHESLSSLILDYCKATDDGEEGSRIFIMDEYDEGPPTGTHAMLSLVEQNKKWIPDYIAFLRTNNLDEEVEQQWDIKAIIDRYGWCDETLRLAIARNISCIGQAGREQFNQFLNDGLTEYLNDSKNRELFISFILQEFDNWNRVEKRLKDGSKKYYISYIVNCAQNFNEILSTDEIKRIEDTLMKRWDEFQETDKEEDIE